MAQTNTTYYQDEQSKKMLARFEKVEADNFINHNKIDIKALSTSLQVRLGCGCVHVHHFGLRGDSLHYQRHYVELCNKHKLSAKELEG